MVRAAGKFHVGNAVIAKTGNIAERENTAKYMKSQTISGMDGQAKKLRPDDLIPVGCQAKANEAGLQAGYNRIKCLFQRVSLKTAPSLERVGVGELPAVEQASFAAREAPLIGLMEEIPIQHHEIWNYVADLSQIEMVTAGGGIFGPDFFPEAEQGAGAGMQDLGNGLACFRIVVN